MSHPQKCTEVTQRQIGENTALSQCTFRARVNLRESVDPRDSNQRGPEDYAPCYAESLWAFCRSSVPLMDTRGIRRACDIEFLCWPAKAKARRISSSQRRRIATFASRRLRAMMIHLCSCRKVVTSQTQPIEDRFLIRLVLPREAQARNPFLFGECPQDTLTGRQCIRP